MEYDDLFTLMKKNENKSKRKGGSNNLWNLSVERVNKEHLYKERHKKRINDEMNNDNLLSKKIQKLNINDSPSRNNSDSEDVFESISKTVKEKHYVYNSWKKELNDKKSIIYESQIIKASSFFNNEKEIEIYSEKKPIIKLWKHQKNGINFMINRELDKDEINCFGGMQCDEPGMGKTLQMLELIRKRNLISIKNTKNRFNGPTIIISSSLIINYWIDYIKNNYSLNTFEILTLFPENKTKVNNYLFYDIIFTTYHIVSASFRYITNDLDDEDDVVYHTCKQFLWIFKVPFLRILCDESDIMINKKNIFFKSIQSIKAIHRWYITGTPLKNNLNDTLTAFEFIGLKFKDNENEKSITILKKYLDIVMIRRFKNDKDINFAYCGKCTVSIILIDFLNENEREVYSNYNKILKPLKGGKIELKEKNNHIFSIITKLRQCCINTLIIDDIQLPNNILRINFLTDKEPYLTKINEGQLIPEGYYINQKEKEIIDTYKYYFEYLKKEKKFFNHDYLNKKLKSKILPKFSTKGKAIINYIENSTKKDDKVVIYYESIKALIQISNELKSFNISFLLLSGENKDHNERNIILKRFENENIKVLLITKVCNQGISLVCANHVIIVGPGWTPWPEIQSIHRCYRPGQTKNVKVVYFIIKNTIEEYIMNLSFNKLKLSNMLLEKEISTNDSINISFEEFVNMPQDLSKEDLKTKLIDLFIH